MAFAMIYMYWLGMPAVGTSSHSATLMSGPSAGAGDPSLTLLLVLALLASAIWQLDGIGQLATAESVVVAATGDGRACVGGRGDRPGNRPWIATRLEVGCHTVMCFAMAYVLVLAV